MSLRLWRHVRGTVRFPDESASYRQLFDVDRYGDDVRIYTIMKKRGVFDDFLNRFNYEDHGGTPILGLNKTVIIGHGISNEIAIKNMILLTQNITKSNLVDKIKTNIE